MVETKKNNEKIDLNEVVVLTEVGYEYTTRQSVYIVCSDPITKKPSMLFLDLINIKKEKQTH